MTIKNYYILTGNIEDFKYLEKAYEDFRKNYSINLIDSKLIVRENPILNTEIWIYPEKKDSEISSMKVIKKDLEAKMLESSNNHWLIELKNRKYIIKKKNLLL